MNTNIFEEVRNRVNILDVCDRLGIRLNRSYKAICPFPNHREKTPSFSVSKTKNIFCCFGCGKKGDSINLVQEMLNCTPLEAVKQLNQMFNLGINFEKDKTKPKFEYDKQYAQYKNEKKKEMLFSREKLNIYNNLYEAATLVYKYWRDLKLLSKSWSIEIYGEYLSTIYKNEMYFEYIVDLFDNGIDFIYENRHELKKTLEEGIIFMDFEKISFIAFKEEDMPEQSSLVELLTYYRLKELYIKHYKKQINSEEAKKEKQKIKAFYDKQVSMDNFDSELRKQVSDNIVASEDEVVQMIKSMNNKADIKQICDIAISCVAHLTNNTMLEKIYKENY